ncbi:MAG: hypothetical protein ACYDDU_20965 [Dermatophilaceae bacterium]
MNALAVELAARVMAATTPCDLVVDRLLGWGIGALVALQQGRRFIGGDTNPQRCARCDRLQEPLRLRPTPGLSS